MPGPTSARDTPGRDAHAAKKKPKKVPKKKTTTTSIDEILSSPMPGTTFRPPPPPKKVPKKPPKSSKPPPFSFEKAATELRSYQDLVKEGRKAFFADVPPWKRVSRDPGSYKEFMASQGDFDAPSAPALYVQRKREYEATKRINAEWREQREQEWQDLLSGKTERETKAAFFADADKVNAMPKGLWERQHPDESYNAYRERLKSDRREQVAGNWARFQADPEKYIAEEARKPRDIVGKVSAAGIGGMEFLGLPKSIANDLRLISAGALPGIMEVAKVAWDLGHGDPARFSKMVNDTVESYRMNYQSGKSAGEYARNHPLLFGFDAAIILGPITKVASVIMLSRKISMANPGMNQFTANQLAGIESRQPGYLAAQGIEGGIAPRQLEGKDYSSDRPRPQSRSPIGRGSQRAYDALSKSLEAGPLENVPGVARIGTSARAASADAKAGRRDRQRQQALINAFQDPVADFTTKKGKARLRRLIGQSIPERGRAEALIAALEAGTDVTTALTERIAALRSVLDQGIMWDRPEIVSESRDKFIATLAERFEPDVVEQLTTLSDSMARAAMPRNPGRWYDTRLADSSNMSGEDFMRSGAAAAAQFQLKSGKRGGLLEGVYREAYFIDDGQIENTLDHQQEMWDPNIRQSAVVIYFLDDQGMERSIIATETGFEMFNRTTGDTMPMTREEASNYLHHYGEDMVVSSTGKNEADWLRETPVFYSPLQRAIADLPGTSMKAKDLKKELEKAGIGKIEREMMGLDAFFYRETATLSKNSGKWYEDPDKEIPYANLQAHLHDPLNAYNLDEMVRASTTIQGEGKARWFNHDYYGNNLVARVPTPNEPYYEITMTLGDLHPRQQVSGQKYEGKGYNHWDEKNVVVHIRFHIIVDLDGKRSMLIDEIQSDWASEWHKAGGWEYDDPKLNAALDDAQTRLRETHQQITDIIAEPRRRLDDARNAEDQARYAIEDWHGGDSDEIADLELVHEQASAELKEAFAQHEANLRMHQDWIDELNEKAREINKEITNLIGAKGLIPPPMKGKEMNAAVRRAARWAAEADVDRIIIVPGEVQAFRNNAYGVTPKGRKIDLMSLNNQNLRQDREAWVEDVQGMDTDELREYGRNVGAVASNKAKSYFRLYEQDIPNMFGKFLKSDPRFVENVYVGHYGDQTNAFGGPYGEPTPSWIGGTVIDMTPEAKEMALKPMALFQRQPNWDGLPRGATEFLDNGRTAMRLFDGADVDTVIHELAHIALTDLPEDMLSLLEDHFGGPRANWTEQQHEAFARGFEAYLYSGNAPTPELQKAFSRIRQWIAAIWDAMKQDPASYSMTPEMNEVFETMVLPKDRSPLDPKQRNFVQAQIEDLQYALDNPGDPEEQAAALTAMRSMSSLVEEYGRQIMLFGLDETPDPDTGISELDLVTDEIDQMLDRRRVAYTDLLQSMGIIDPQDAVTRAEGYFPNLSIWRTGGDTPLDPTKLPATGNVMGVPRARPDAVNMKRNQFVRFQTGGLSMNPAVLFDVLRMRVKHLATLEIRQKIYDRGTPVVKDKDIDDYDRTLMFVRDPGKEASKIREQTRAALGMDEDSFVALVERGQDPAGEMDTMDSDGTATKTWSDNVWWRGKEGTRPSWVVDESTVRTVKRDIAEKLVGEVFPSAPRGGAIAPSANALARISMLYAPGPIPGSRYMVRNFLQNAVLMGLTNPSSLRHAVTAVRTLEKDEHRQLRNEIDAEAGSTRAEAALPEYYLRAQNWGQRREREITEFQKKVGGGLSKVADDPFRRSAWIGYAERYGFHGPEGWARLLRSDEPAIARTRDLISQAVRDDLIDFDAMSSKERAFASHYFFLYPFIRGSLKWPFMFLREYPFRAGVVGSLAAQQGQARERDALAKTTSEAGRSTLTPGKEQKEFGWLDPFGPSAQTFESFAALIQGAGNRDFTALAQMLSPEYRAAIESLSGNASKTRPWGAFLSSFMPGYSTYEKSRRGGSLSDQLMRHMGLSVEPSPSRQIQRKQAQAELIDAWTWAQSVGLNLDVDEVSRSAKAWEKYQDLDQRIDFSQKDLGEGSLRSEDLSDAQILEREQQKALALTAAVAEGYPDTRKQMTAQAKKIRSNTLAQLKAYNEAMAERAFRAYRDLINAYKRSQG